MADVRIRPRVCRIAADGRQPGPAGGPAAPGRGALARLADARAARYADAGAHRRGGAKALRDGRTGYPDNQGEPALREAVAEKLAARPGPHLRPRPRDPDHRRGDARRLRRARGAGRAGRRRRCCPTRSTTPTTRRSRSGAAVPVPVAATLREGRFTLEQPRSSRTRGSRTRASSCSTRPGTRSAPS